MSTYLMNFVIADKYGNIYQGPNHGLKNGADRLLLVGAEDKRTAKLYAREYYSMSLDKGSRMSYPQGVIAVIEGDISAIRPVMYQLKDDIDDTPRWTRIDPQHWPTDIVITWFDGSVTDSLANRPRRIAATANLHIARSVLKVNTKPHREIVRGVTVISAPRPNSTPDPSRMQRMPTEVYTVRYIACPNCHEAIQLPKEGS